MVCRGTALLAALCGCLLGLDGCTREDATKALPVDNAGEMKALMQDCRDTYAAAGKYLTAHKAFPDQDKVKESLQPLLKAGSKADLSKFVQAFPGGRAALNEYMDGNPSPMPEYGHYAGTTGTASVMFNGDVRWSPKQ